MKQFSINNTLPSILLIDSSYPINTRNIRIIQTLQKYFGDNSVKNIAWNRDGRYITNKNDDSLIYCVKSAYGNPVSKVIHMVGYFFFIKKINKQIAPKIIIASHWDILFLASLIKRKEQHLIYENLDIPTANNTFLRKLFECIERLALEKTDAIIFASRFFKPLYNSFLKEKFVLENKPLKVLPVLHVTRNTEILIISYIGLIRYAEILKNLIDAIRERKNVYLYLHGEGQDLITLKKYAHNSSNIFFTGRYETEKLPQLYAEADIVWAAYPNKDYNVKYAISNKFHESIAYQVPCIYAKETYLGDFVEDKKIGYTVNPYDVNEVNKLIDYILENRSDVLDKRHTLALYGKQEENWEMQFQPIKNYLDTLK